MIIENLSQFDQKIAQIKLQYGPPRAGDVPHSLANIEKKGKSIIGYQPEYTVKKGLEDACKWYWEKLK